jgi:phage terminase large subunit
VNNELELRYFRQAAFAGCPVDQLTNFIRAEVVLQPRQLAASAAARSCDADDGPDAIGYGGARAGGKSHWLIAQMGADDCQRRAGLKCLLLRKVGKANIEHFEALRMRIFRKLPHEFNITRAILTFSNGSKIVAGHFQAEKDIDAYLGLEYDVIGIEEATTLSERKYRDISTCCRTSKPDFRPRIYSTTNPGGVGHEWYKRVFVRPAPGAAPTRFVSARITDNSFTNRDYEKQLQKLSGWQRRAWLEGDWDIAAGQFFTGFRHSDHVRNLDHIRRNPAFPEQYRWFAALDYGYTHYTVCLVAALDHQGILHVVEEHAERRWLPSQHAQAIDSALGKRGLRLHHLSGFVAGADIFAKQWNGRSVADEYAAEGIHLKPANMDRQNGWASIIRRLGDPLGGHAPRMFIDPRCAKLIAQIPALQHDPNRPEDVLKIDVDDDTGEGGDDAADACRYLVNTITPTCTLRLLKS